MNSTMVVVLNVTQSQASFNSEGCLEIRLPCETVNQTPIITHLERELDGMTDESQRFVIHQTLDAMYSALRIAAIATLVRRER